MVCKHTNYPHFGPGAPSGQDSKPKYASKDEALQRLKSIINQSKKSSVTGEHNVISTNAVFSNAVCKHIKYPYFEPGAPIGQDSKPK